MRYAFMFLFFTLYAMPAFAEESAASCAAKAASIHTRMTRAEVEALMKHDGGEAGMFKGERLYFANLKPGEKPDMAYFKRKFCMLNIDFHPFELDYDTFHDVNKFAQWLQNNHYRTNPRDVAVKISAPFVDTIHFD